MGRRRIHSGTYRLPTVASGAQLTSTGARRRLPPVLVAPETQPSTTTSKTNYESLTISTRDAP